MKASSINSRHAAATSFVLSLQRTIFLFAIKLGFHKVVPGRSVYFLIDTKIVTKGIVA